MLLLRGRQGACGTGLVLVACLVASGAAVFCMAGVAVGDIDVAGVALMASSGTGLGVALGDIDGRFAWRAWRLVTLTYLLCGRCGAW